RLQGAPSPVDGVWGRASPVLPGAAAGCRGLQSLLLAPDGAAPVRRARRRRPVGHGHRPGLSVGPARVHARTPPLRPRSPCPGRRGGLAMMRVGRLLKDYRDSGAINPLIALWGFVDEQVFLTKAGHVGLVYHLAGVDPEGLTHA